MAGSSMTFWVVFRHARLDAVERVDHAIVIAISGRGKGVCILGRTTHFLQ